VGVLLEEVVLDLPGVLDAGALGDLDLLQRVAEQIVLAVGAPGAGQLVLEEDPEPHAPEGYAADGSRVRSGGPT